MRKKFLEIAEFLLQFPKDGSTIKLQSKTGSCNEVLRARAATITRLLQSVSNHSHSRRFETFFVIRGVLFSVIKEELSCTY